MAEKENCKLFSEFAPNTMQEWIDKVTVDLKGADFNKKLVWRTNEGFNVQPMYRLENMQDLPQRYPDVHTNRCYLFCYLSPGKERTVATNLSKT